MKFEDYEQGQEALYKEFAGRVKAALEDAISRAEGLPRIQSIQCRAKSLASLKLKLLDRGILDSEHIEDEIKDLAGARVILYTNTDVDRFLGARLIPTTFKVHWEETRVHHPTDENERRRYQAFHYTVSLDTAALAPPESVKFADLRCEIQIQTLLDHAWAESSHDIIYKARNVSGFGSKALQSLDSRLIKIMDDHLRPAGFDFQKVQHDYERLMQGKALFDRGTMETLEQCDNNNDRHSILSTIAEHVIPNYDDLEAVYPEIRRALLDAVRVARETKTQPVETQYGSYEGKTAQDITYIAITILERLRYVDVEGTLQALIDLRKDEPDLEVRKSIVEAVRNLAQYDIDVWKQAGPYVQAVLVDFLAGLSPAAIDDIRPIVLTIWREALSADLDGTTFSANSVTISKGAVPADPNIKPIRNKAIDGLIALFDRSSSELEKREVISAIREATRSPSQGGYGTGLFEIVLCDSVLITDFLTQRVDKLPFEVLEHVEHELLFDYRRTRPIASGEHDQLGCQDSAASLIGAIERFRDQANLDTQYVRYKTLVGFEAVFAEHWEDEEFDYERVEKYREREAAAYIDELTDDSADEWITMIRRCAATKSNDMATFPVFSGFLRDLAKAKPAFAFRLIELNDQNVMVFFTAILVGLSQSFACDQYLALVDRCLDTGANLGAVARHLRVAEAIAPEVVCRTLARAIAANDPLAAFECLIFAIQRHDFDSMPLVETVYVPALTYLIEKKDARWIHGAWFLREAKPFFESLPPEEATLALENLAVISKVDHQVERVLAYIAQAHPQLIWKFFERRLEEKRESEGQFEAIPYQLHDLPAVLARDAMTATAVVRGWFRSGDHMFQFTGGRLLHAVFPTCTEALADGLGKVATGGTDEDYDFVIHVLQNYRGEPAMHEVVRQIVNAIPADDLRIGRLQWCLESTGVVSGEFGMVDALRRKKTEMTAWQNDERLRVREFTAAFIRHLDQRIASEQRSAEQRKELRKRDFDEDDGA